MFKRTRTMVALRGAAALTFGLLTLAWPGLTLGFLTVVFGLYALADGVLAAVAAIGGGDAVAGRRGWVAVEGVVGILAGFGALLWPGITAIVLLATVAVWAIVVGTARMVSAARGDWGTIVAGAVAVLFGILLLAWPVSGALALAWLVGLGAAGFGISLLVSAWRMRRLEREAAAPATWARV